MKKTERLNGIVLLLKAKGRLTCTELSDHFEVSERTIYRDIDALSQLKVPIISYEGAGGGYEISMDYFMPNFKLSKDEITILLMVLKLGDQLKLPNLSSHYKLLESKIFNALDATALEKTQVLINKINFYISRIEPKNYEEDILSTILQVIEESLQLNFDYCAPRNNCITSRVISIYELFFDEGGWYIMGYCHLRKEKRTFRLDRMTNVKKSIRPALLNENLKSSTEKFLVTAFTVQMTPSFYRIVKENDYMRSHRICSEESALTIEITSRYRDSIIELALSNPDDMQIIAPKECVDIIKNKIKSLNNYY